MECSEDAIRAIGAGSAPAATITSARGTVIASNRVQLSFQAKGSEPLNRGFGLSFQ